MIPDTASLWTSARKFESILRKDPGAYSFAPLADIYRQLGILDDALETARRGVALYPDFASGQMALAKAAFESGLKGEALKALERVVAITPENLEAQRLLADLYTEAGEESAASRCLEIVGYFTLDAEPCEIRSHASSPEYSDDLLFHDDVEILELSDEFIEEDFVDGGDDPFAASPERPSLGDDAARAEPFLLETAPPLYAEKEEEPETAPSTVSSATIAELYVSQGFIEKGVDIYRELLSANPGDEVYRKRLAELSGDSISPATETAAEMPLSAVTAPQGIVDGGILEKLSAWLLNIGRVRECRTRTL